MVVTFTNKAAGELKQRLFAAISEATQLASPRLQVGCAMFCIFLGGGEGWVW